MKLILIFFCLINFAFLSAEELLTCFLHKHGWCYFEEKTIGYDVKTQFAAKNIPSEHVKNVIFESSLIREVPAELFSSFVSLEKLRMIGQNVEDIRPDTFLSAKKLMRLNLSSNRIKSLKTGTFDGATSLQELFMCCGLLTEINKESLRDLRYLRTISFSGNQIKFIHKNAFEDLDELRSISLNTNQLIFIHKNLFRYNDTKIFNKLNIYYQKHKLHQFKKKKRKAYSGFSLLEKLPLIIY